MQKVRCISHEEEFCLATSDEEFSSGKFHEQIESCQKHHNENPSCRFCEVVG